MSSSFRAQSPAASYSVHPIDPKSEIRIIHLLPPALSHPDRLRCLLTTAKLWDSPKYEAVSYAWGEPVFPERLYLPSGYLAITTNLAAALRRFRYADRVRNLWVDAVCINQQDSEEKRHQVKLMADVYSRAECGLCWLGEGTEMITATMALYIAVLKQNANIEGQLYQDDDTFIWPRHFSFHLLNLFWSALNWRVVDAFFAQAWFDRLWVIQEFVLPTRVCFCNGSVVITPDELNLMIICIKEYFYINKSRSRVTVETSKTISYCSQIFAARRKFLRDDINGNTAARTPLFQHVTEFAVHKKGCQDDRDRVYGMLGLQDRRTFLNFDVEYDKSVGEVYIDFALSYLREGKLDILHFVPPRPRIRDSTEEIRETPAYLPSWCPDWRISTHNSDLANEGFYSATELMSSIIVEQHNLPAICIRGVILDTIKDTFPLPTTESPVSSQLVELSKLCYSSLGNPNYHTGITQEEAFARTLLFDCRLFFLRALRLTDPYMHWESLVRMPPAIETDADLNRTDPDFLEALQITVLHYNLFTTETGYIGSGTRFAEVGDVVMIFDGAQSPFVLREMVIPQKDGAENTDKEFDGKKIWRVIGDCYIHGFMDNEVLRPEFRERAEMIWVA